MNWFTRLLLIAGGLGLILLAVVQLRNGQMVFDNSSYHQTTFAAGGIGVGIVILLLAFLPPGEWVYKHITTKRNNVLHSERRSGSKARHEH
ncbi:hypothetical protein [Acidobacterium sp. S8]|uniref:hypothetical protein n=1 Tax=Acidobacterium sp. S8 TaxID=1641854 RepID=UPI001C2051D3|nr:hypothetical protein [Acidobacterium sp. S8]